MPSPRVYLKFDRASLVEYARRGTSPGFNIHWEHGETCYPSHYWEERGIVLIMNWLLACIQLLDGATDISLEFMEDDRVLLINRSDSMLVVSALDSTLQWVMSTDELIEELLKSGENILAHFDTLGMFQSDCITLRRVMVMVRDRKE